MNTFERKHIPTRQQAADLSKKYKQSGKKVVFTNGVFDLVHRGHIEYLEEAKALGDILIVGVNSDESVKSYKGDKRPIIALEDRLALLSALECVDHVIEFGERLPNDIISFVQPDIHVKGGDYTKDQLPEAAVVEQCGGKVVIMPFAHQRSTSAIIQKIIDVYKA